MLNLIIGNNIKNLRKARGITQEQLAEAVGISFQAVSKWENHIALPDITLVPILASYFNVSTDELLGYHAGEMDRKVHEICREAYEYRASDPEKSRKLLEEGLKHYPDNDIILNNILYVLDYKRNPDEMIAAASKLIDKTNMPDVKYDAMRFLAYAYKAKGDMESAGAALEQIPEIYFTKLSEMAAVFTGEKKFEAAKKEKWISFEIMIQMMSRLAECYEMEGQRAKAAGEIECAIKLIDIACRDNKYFEDYTKHFKEWLEKLKVNV